jgi:hypothetical protein
MHDKIHTKIHTGVPWFPSFSTGGKPPFIQKVGGYVISESVGTLVDGSILRILVRWRSSGSNPVDSRFITWL